MPNRKRLPANQFGRFIVFEGIDGVGKSTQQRLLVDFLRAGGQEVLTCQDPGTTALGCQIREILLHSREEEIPLHMNSEMLLYMAARSQLVAEVIRPALEQGSTVVSDRFLLSNIVYQGYGGGLDVEDLRQIGEVAIAGVRPDASIVLDLPPEVAAARRSTPPDRIEQRGLEFQKKLRAGFLAEAKSDPTIHVIDAERSVEEIHADVLNAVASLI